MENTIRLYDGASFCGKTCPECPVVDYSAEKDEVTVYDPAKPQNGSFKMTSAEYNALLKNAKLIAL